jgi:hypothetical protein
MVGWLDNIRWHRNYRRNPLQELARMEARYGGAFTIRSVGFNQIIVVDRDYPEVC